MKRKHLKQGLLDDGVITTVRILFDVSRSSVSYFIVAFTNITPVRDLERKVDV